MDDLNEAVAKAVSFDLARIKDDNQTLRLALLAVLAMTEDGGSLPDWFRTDLICHLRPMGPYWTKHSTPFTEDYRIERRSDGGGDWHLTYTADFLQSLAPH